MVCAKSRRFRAGYGWPTNMTNENDLINLTGTCGTGPKGQKTWHKILRGSHGKFGPELLIDLTEVEKAVTAKAHTFVDKQGHKWLSIRPKFWAPKPEADMSSPRQKPPIPVQYKSPDEDDDRDFTPF